jgi:hypothetical protein
LTAQKNGFAIVPALTDAVKMVTRMVTCVPQVFGNALKHRCNAACFAPVGGADDQGGGTFGGHNLLQVRDASKKRSCGRNAVNSRIMLASTDRLK